MDNGFLTPRSFALTPAAPSPRAVVVGERQRLAVVVVLRSSRVDAQGREPGVEQVADVVLLGSSRTCPARSSRRPTTPRFRPQPAIASDQASGQWSRPTWPLIRGVRPNSLMAITSTLSSMPRSARSSIIAAKAWSNFGTRLQVAVEVVAVRVPAVGVHLHERDARLEHLAGQQHVPAELVRAVALDVLGIELAACRTGPAASSAAGHVVDVAVGLVGRAACRWA